MKTYSNPRMEAIIGDWPISSKRTTATFRIEAKPGKGERATRFTIEPKTSKPSATKVLTFSTMARIVDGNDGRTYIIEWSRLYGFVSVMRGDMKFQEETIFPGNPRFEEVRALFDIGGHLPDDADPSVLFGIEMDTAS